MTFLKGLKRFNNGVQKRFCSFSKDERLRSFNKAA